MATPGPAYRVRQEFRALERPFRPQNVVHSAENRWYIVAENTWYILAEKKWYISRCKLTPNSGQLLALVDALHAGTLNDAQRETVQALRTGILALAESSNGSARPKAC